MKYSYYEEKSKLTGKSHFYLVRYYGSYRSRKSLNLSCPTSPTTFEGKKQRNNVLRLVEQIVVEKQYECVRGMHGIPDLYRTDEDFFQVGRGHISKLDRLNIETKKYTVVLKHLEAFVGKKTLPCYEITESLLTQFVKYMEQRFRGQTAQGYTNRLKILIKAAVSENYFRTNPAQNLKARQIGSIQKAVLTLEEIQTLKETPLGNEEVKRAFLFACYTALRYCDVKLLKWENIRNNRIHIIQKKTQHELTLPLTEEALLLLGERKMPDEKIFQLPSHTSVSKWLRKWSEAAGINKKFSYHSARHSLATNLIAQNINIAVASKVLGHCNISQTQRYVRISEELKLEALKTISLSKTDTKND